MSVVTLLTTGARAAAADSPSAQTHPLPLAAVRWTDGFWAARSALCRQQTIPAMWRLMSGTNYSQFYENFRIAAGMADGRHRGAPFNDGDFYKWIEAASASLAATNDPALAALLDDVIETVRRAQRADGYLHTPVLIRQRNGDASAKPFQDRQNFEMYNMGHLLTAACVHHQATGRTNLLSIARKTGDFLVETFRGATPDSARSSVCPAHYMGIIDLYRETGDPRYLDLARKLVQLRGQVADGGDDNQDRLPFEQQTNAMGHAVRANYLYAGATDLFLETGERDFWRPLSSIWTNVVEQKMYITGGCGALYDGASPDGAKEQKVITRVHQAYGRNYQLPNATAHSETCANIGNVLWNWRMVLATGEARYMDIVETALYNGVLSGVGLDGTNFFYTNPLRVTEPLPVDLRWPRRRVPFVSSFCCPPNLARTIAEVGGYAYARSGDSLFVNLYGGNELVTAFPNALTFRLVQETAYPWNGRVRLSVAECATNEFALKLRIPGWSANAAVRVNGRREGREAVPASYFEVRRSWLPGDVVELEIPMPVRVMEANPLVEETLNQVAIQRGPVVYCLESAGLPAGVRPLDISVPEDIDFVVRYDRNLLGGMVVLEGQAPARPGGQWDGRLYRESRTVSAKPVKVSFLPYFAWGNRDSTEMSVWLPRGRP